RPRAPVSSKRGMLRGRWNELDGAMAPRAAVRIEVEHVELQIEDIPTQCLERIFAAKHPMQLLEEVLMGGDEDAPAAMMFEEPQQELAGARLQGRKRLALRWVERIADVANLQVAHVRKLRRDLGPRQPVHQPEGAFRTQFINHDGLASPSRDDLSGV